MTALAMQSDSSTTLTRISIARDFSEFPAGRYLSDGPYSGEKFRREILVKALSNFNLVEIDLDGTEGYGSSFLEEAFGGLVREHNFQPDDLLARMLFFSKEDLSLIEEIKSYLRGVD